MKKDMYNYDGEKLSNSIICAQMRMDDYKNNFRNLTDEELLKINDMDIKKEFLVFKASIIAMIAVAIACMILRKIFFN